MGGSSPAMTVNALKSEAPGFLSPDTSSQNKSRQMLYEKRNSCYTFLTREV